MSRSKGKVARRTRKLASIGLGRTTLPVRDAVRYAPPEMRLFVLGRDHYQCRYCRKPVTSSTANIDHVVPWKLGGATQPSNLVTACGTCNKEKGNRPGISPQFRPGHALNDQNQAARERRLHWWNSLTAEEQEEYRNQKVIEREMAALDEEFKAIVSA